MSACPKGGEHQYRKTYEGGGWIEHTCRKCGDVIRRKQGKSKTLADGVGWGAGFVLPLLGVLILAAGGLVMAGWMYLQVAPHHR